MGVMDFAKGVDVTASAITMETVSTVAAKKIAEFDSNTARIFAKGFSFGGKQFSLAPDAVLNAIKLYPLSDILPYPIPWSLTNYTKTFIKDATEFRTFYATMMTVEFAARGEATTLRDSVAAIVVSDLPDAEKIQAILAIKDTRE